MATLRVTPPGVVRRSKDRYRPRKIRGLFAYRGCSQPTGTVGFRNVNKLMTIAVATLLVSLAGPLWGTVAPSRAYTVQTVEISEGGFNPPECRMNREYVRFKNVGTTPRRVIRPGVVPGDPPLIDTGVLKPGEFSNEILIPHGGSTKFYDAANLAHSVTVVTPVFVESWEPICTPDPNYQPPQPPCRSNPFCVRMAALAAD